NNQNAALMPTTPTSNKRRTTKALNKPCVGGRGGRHITSASPGSNASAIASVTAVIMLTHNTCTGVIGNDKPSITATSKTPASTSPVGTINRIALTILS